MFIFFNFVIILLIKIRSSSSLEWVALVNVGASIWRYMYRYWI